MKAFISLWRIIFTSYYNIYIIGYNITNKNNEEFIKKINGVFLLSFIFLLPILACLFYLLKFSYISNVLFLSLTIVLSSILYYLNYKIILISKTEDYLIITKEHDNTAINILSILFMFSSIALSYFILKIDEI